MHMFKRTHTRYARGAAGADLIFFIFFLIVLGIVWALTGGPSRDISREGAFLNPPFPLGSGEAYDVPGVSIPRVNTQRDAHTTTNTDIEEEPNTLQSIIARIRGEQTGISTEDMSPYAGKVTFERGRPKNSSAETEYLKLETQSTVDGRIVISDWRVESAISLRGTTLGDAAYLPYSGQVNTESPVALGPDITIFVVSGRSPIGASFRVNTCTGYFAQFQEFTPDLREECPHPEDELKRVTNVDFIPNDACINFVENIRRCTFTTGSIPQQVGSACQNFILNELTYNGCVNAHKNEADFYKNEWYIYLDRDQELWNNTSDRIRLLDEDGLIVDELSY